MRRTKITRPLLGLFFLLATSPSWSTPVLQFVPSTPTVDAGDVIWVDVQLSDLDGLFIGAFDIEVTWASSVLALLSVEFGDALGGPVDSFQDYFDAPGFVSVSELSLLFDLFGLQDGYSPITLFSLHFDAIVWGFSQLEFGSIMIFDDFGNEITVTTTTVPEPGTLWLLSMGLVAMGFRLRQKK